MTPALVQVQDVGQVGVVEPGVQQRRVGVLQIEARVDQLGGRAVHGWPEPVPGAHGGPSRSGDGVEQAAGVPEQRRAVGRRPTATRPTPSRCRRGPAPARRSAARPRPRRHRRARRCRGPGRGRRPGCTSRDLRRARHRVVARPAGRDRGPARSTSSTGLLTLAPTTRNGRPCATTPATRPASVPPAPTATTTVGRPAGELADDLVDGQPVAERRRWRWLRRAARGRAGRPRWRAARRPSGSMASTEVRSASPRPAQLRRPTRVAAARLG